MHTSYVIYITLFFRPLVVLSCGAGSRSAGKLAAVIDNPLGFGFIAGNIGSNNFKHRFTF